MADMQSLNDLKRENENDSQPDNLKDVQAVVDDNSNVVSEQVDQTAAVDENTQADGSVESPAENEADEGQEYWLSDSDYQPDDDSGQTVDLQQHIRIRQKLKEKNRNLEAEVEELKRRVGDQTMASQQQPHPGMMRRPTLEDFDYDEGQYNAAVEAWNLEQINVRMNQQEQARRFQAQQAAIQNNINQHYNRASELINKHNIDANTYSEADKNVRQAMDDLTGNGDIITDMLINALGEGSEKLIYMLGRNQDKLNNLQTLLGTDPSGLKAAMFLGKEMAKMNNKGAKPVSQAKAPPAQQQGGGDVSPQAASGKKRAYDNAKTPQEKWNIRREARQSGIDVRDW